MSRVEEFGSVSWWGFSPALDLCGLAELEEDYVHILVVGGADLRHVLETLSHAQEHSMRRVQFYIVEGSLEVVARQILFLSLFYEPFESLGLQEKTELFLELYGNTLIRSHTATYLRQKATDLIKMVTDLDYLHTKIPSLDLSQLKFKERDMLEGIFKFWRLPEPNVFNIERHWEARLRHHLGVRYDSRSGVFDWDYHMKLHDIAPIVSSREYQSWREGGVAFCLRDDAPYDQPNLSLVSGLLLMQGGERVARRGYYGDIVNSPFISLGIESVNKDLFKTANTKYLKGSRQVSEWNVQNLIEKLTMGGRGPRTKAQQTQLPSTIQEEEEEEEEEARERATDGDVKKYQTSRSTVDGLLYNAAHRIVFLPLNSLMDLQKKAKYKKLFSVAYFSNSMVHHLSNGIEATFSPGCTLVLETARFMLDIKKEQKLVFVQKVTEMAKSVGFTDPLHCCIPEKCNYLAFSHPRQ